MSTIANIIRGNKLFKKNKLAEFKEQLEDSISNGQHPDILLISCCDSRVTTDFMFGNKAGDLFVLRNIGNLIPVFEASNDFYSVASAIEYAINILEVSHVIVCGHSYCGACESLYKDIPKENKSIKRWLENAQDVKEFTLKSTYKTKEELYRATEKNSIIFQLENLRTYPCVQNKIDNNTLELHGWYYDLEDGSLQNYNKTEKKFMLIE